MAAVSLIHEWLPGTWNKSLEKFAPVLTKAKIKRVRFLRYVQNAPSKGVYFDRLLTDNGREQAREAGISFGRDL
jgi:hypothetical protein